jgi:hypothetical protein
VVATKEVEVAVDQMRLAEINLEVALADLVALVKPSR